MKTKNLILSGLLIAIGIVTAFVLKNFGGQVVLRLFSPLHLPVLIAGLALGPTEGIICGILTPLLSYLINQLPPMGPLAMMAELAVYGLVTGMIMKYGKNLKPVIRLYTALISAMILGRIAGGLVTAFVLNGGNYSLQIWISTYFIATLPAILTDLILIPIIIKALRKAGLIHSL